MLILTRNNYFYHFTDDKKSRKKSATEDGLKKNIKNSLKKFQADRNSVKIDFDEKGKHSFRKNMSGEIEKKLKADNCDFFQEECDSEISDDSSDEVRTCVRTYLRFCVRYLITIFLLFILIFC